VLLVNAYVPDLVSDVIPLSAYTDLLQQNGYAYDLWDIAGGRPSPTAGDLQPYRVVVWRLNDGLASSDTLSDAQQRAISDYVNHGGALFMASMELLAAWPMSEARGSPARCCR